MLALPLLWLTNLWRWLRNGWRRVLRRRFDFVRLDLAGALPEFAPAPAWWQQRLLGARAPQSLASLRARLAQIAADPHTSGVLLVVNNFAPGWATAQSLRATLSEFRASGKRVAVYMLAADTRSYYALCRADLLLMPPSAMLNLLGVRIEATFLRDTLALAGIQAEVIAVSPYKSGGDQLTRADMSPENRDQLARLLDGRYAMLLETIAADRKLTQERVRELIDCAPHFAPQAHNTGLLDGTCYEDELEQYLLALRISLRQGQSKLSIERWSRARRALQLPYRRLQRRYVAVVSIEGAISSGSSRNMPLPLPVLGGRVAGSESVSRALRRVERDRRIAALVLHVDSPGGDAYASDLIWREVLRVRQRKPVVVFMGNVAASGGYYVSACADEIVAQPATLTGSIGVYAVRPVAAGLLEKAQINTVVLSRGARSGLFSPTQPLSDDERTALHDTVFSSYATFKHVVREGRHLSDEQLDPIAGGRIWTGSEALDNGLVDALGGLPQAIARARALAKLEPDPAAAVLLVAATGRGNELPPLPFPTPDALALFVAGDLVREALQTRVLAALPFALWE